MLNYKIAMKNKDNGCNMGELEITAINKQSAIEQGTKKLKEKGLDTESILLCIVKSTPV